MYLSDMRNRRQYPYSKDIRLTIINDSTIERQNLKAVNDFSCLVQCGNKNVLFGTGDYGMILLSNMKKMGINPKDIDLVFVSYDCCGYVSGLEDLLSENAHIKVLVQNSFPELLKQAFMINEIHVINIPSSEEIYPNIFTLGEFSSLITEQTMLVKTANGMIVVIGPTHYYHIMSILWRVSDVFPEYPIYMVICGFGLSRVSEFEKRDILECFQILKVKKIALCYGSDVICHKIFRKYFQHNCMPIGAGSVFEFAPVDETVNLDKSYSSILNVC